LEAQTDDALVAALKERAASGPPANRKGLQAYLRPASSETIATAEEDLGFPLEPFLRRVYAEVVGGGIGPGYGLLPLSGQESLPVVYREFRAHGWPEKLLPAWDWGCAIWSCVDCGDSCGSIVTHHGGTARTLTRFTTRSWLRSWMDGVDLLKELFEENERTIINPFTRKPQVIKVQGNAKGRPWPVR